VKSTLVSIDGHLPLAAVSSPDVAKQVPVPPLMVWASLSSAYYLLVEIFVICPAFVLKLDVRKMNTIVYLLISVFGPLHSEVSSSRIVSFYGYDDCILLSNSNTRVTLCPAAGGRVLEYALDAKNALYLPPGNEGWIYEPGKKGGGMAAGRFDIGPEKMIAPRPLLWKGRWKGEITGKLSARMTSQKSDSTGVQLIRDFTLSPDSSRLDCRQTIVNVSQKPVEYCHWSRTFALGGGVVIIPISEPRRFPNGYIMYGGHASILYKPQDPNVRLRDGFLEIFGTPAFAKLGLATHAGWMAYLMKNDQMFVKRYPTYPDRAYNEIAALTTSIWIPKDAYTCELEPIGPREHIKPGETASYTETWWLLPRPFPKDVQAIDLKSVERQVKTQAPKD
jgi:hypothetical protein